MEYKVKRFFIDRDSLKKFSHGDIYPCEDIERAAFLIKKGYLAQEIPTEPPKKPTRSKKKKEG